MPEDGCPFSMGPAGGCIKEGPLPKSIPNGGMAGRVGYVLYNVPHPPRLCAVKETDDAGGSNEGKAARVSHALFEARGRVWLAGWAGDDKVNALRQA